MRIVSMHPSRKAIQSQTDWAAVDALTDDTIDYSDIPPLPEIVTEPVEVIVPKEAITHRRRGSLPNL